MLLARLALPLALIATSTLFTTSTSLASPQHTADKDPDKFLFDVDPDTKAPLGDLVEADGLLLDTRDIPERIYPYLAPCEELEGLEASLTALLGRSLGFAAERKKLPKRYTEFSKHQAGQWEDLVDGLRGRLEVDAAPELVAGALYQDTGRRIDFEANTVRIVGPDRIRELPIAGADLDALLLMQSDVALFGRDMPRKAATRLKDITMDELMDVDDPWFMHASTLIVMLSVGMLEDAFLDNPFDMTHDEFLARCKRSLREALVDPLFPALTENIENNDVWFLEGLVAGQLVGAKDDWPEPGLLVAQNEVVHQPILLVQLKRKREKPGSKLKAARIAMVVAGEVRTLYEGKWPL